MLLRRTPAPHFEAPGAQKRGPKAEKIDFMDIVKIQIFLCVFIDFDKKF